MLILKMNYKFNLLRIFQPTFFPRRALPFAFGVILLFAEINFGQKTSAAKTTPPKKTASQSAPKTIAKTAILPEAKSKSAALKSLPAQNFIISGFNVYVRENPAPSAVQVNQLTFGTIVRSIERSKTEETIVGKKGFWHKITVPNGNSGWIFGAFLKAFEAGKSESIYKQITAEKFKIAVRSFDENKELYEFLTKVQPGIKTPGNAAQIGLWRLSALKSALETIPFDDFDKSPYKDFTAQNTLNIVYSEPGGQWLVRSERYWSLAKRYAALPISEQIAWEAADNSLPGECEGYLNCYLYLLRITDGEYLARFPKGAHAAAALKSIEDSLQPIADDAEKKQTYDLPSDVSDRAEFYKSITELRTIISRTGFFEKEAVLRLLNTIAEGYR